ncbi:metallophosphoesterase [Luteolibacter sp. Populi]|uniref:metallophosphoesterase n=1 Tax=Luteolibacter sp. Populi TaxID=3230487 RepID=UPI0034656BB1
MILRFATLFLVTAGVLAARDTAPAEPSALGATPNPPAVAGPGNPLGLRAWVLESVDKYSGHAGLGELLRRAGFHVEPLPLDRPPYVKGSDAAGDVDLIAIGSFASNSKAYKDYMAAYADDLDDYIDRAGLLVQFAQADQDEKNPPFLPDTQEGTRDDRDFPASMILAPAHPLLAGIPTTDGGRSLAFELTEGESWFKKCVQWESFNRFHGFQVLLSGDAQARAPGLMEGAYGQGRFFVSALGVDKILDPAGTEVAPPSLRAFNGPFFRNLYSYAGLVRDLKTPPLALTPQPGTSLVPDGGWTLVLLPDTQIYSQNFPGIFDAQTAWILHNLRPRNIRYVLHLGDIVNVNSIPEWVNARRSMGMLDGKVPYALVPGNHDYGPGGNAATRETYLNDYFKEDYYKTWPSFGGAMEPGKMDNTYHLFEAGGVKWIVIALEWGPRDSVIEWANGVMDKHPDRKGILITHAYMNNNDLRYDHKDMVNPQAYNPHQYKTPGPVNDGEELWQKLVKNHDFVLTFNGHVLGDGTGYRVDHNDIGMPVHQILANYQFRKLGGEGYLRLVEFQPDGKTVKVRSYSPIYDNNLLESDQDFSFELPLGAKDSDGDGILDYCDADLDDDRDGINNRGEYMKHGTSTSAADTDGDGLGDPQEIAAGTDPLDSDRKVIDAAGKADADTAPKSAK